MATESSSMPAEAPLDRVSRVKGTLFEYATFGASVIGIIALAILLAYVFWDAFGLESAAVAWYALFAGFVLVPAGAFVRHARADPLAGTVALELVSIPMAGLLAGFGLLAILEIIASPTVWFTYFLTVVVPIAGITLVARSRTTATWSGLATLGVVLVGPVVGTLGLGPISRVGALVGGPAIYFVSLVVPGAAGVRYVVDDRLELWNGDLAAGGTLLVALAGVPVVDTFPWLSRSVWLIFLPSFLVPLGIVVGKTLADRERWIGFAGPLSIIVGTGLLLVVPDTLGITGPTPWFDWQYLTSSPSRFPEQAGLYSAIIGSVFIIVLVALVTLLLGVGAALYLEEYAPSNGPGGWITRLIRINISNLAGVPSVVYGILGLAVFANLVGLGFGTVITAAFTLSLLILPIVIIAAQEAIASVPDSLVNASYGMGATRWQTIRTIILPRSIPGILTGTILALGRAIGETAPLIMIGVATTKFSPPTGLLSKTTAMPMQIFAWSTYPSEEFQHGVVAAGVVTLLIVLLSMNSIAILLRTRFEQESY